MHIGIQGQAYRLYLLTICESDVQYVNTQEVVPSCSIVEQCPESMALHLCILQLYCINLI